MNRFGISSIIKVPAAVLTFFFVLTTTPVAADEPPGDTRHIHDEGSVWAYARGARLYDNWMTAMLHPKPEENHPAYPSVGRKRGYPTWRCKECHGWDYKGAEGTSGKSSNHFTGIKGLRDMVGMEPDDIREKIMAKEHGFNEEHLPFEAQKLLSLFLSKGQIDMDHYIDRKTGKAKGSVKHGGPFYQTLCAVCHGTDGKDINFASAKYPSYVGTVCAESPWQALHKIRYGQPGVGMTSLANQEIDFVVDILTYCQTLPAK